MEPKTAEEAPAEEKSGGGRRSAVDKITGPISIVSFMITLPVLAAFVWLLYMKNYECEEVVKLPRLQLGVGVTLAFVFVVSNAAVLLRGMFPAAGLVVAMVPLTVMLTMGMSLVGAYNMESRDVAGSPKWLHAKIFADDNWNRIKSCIYDANVCRDLNFPNNKLSYIESGCCQPPKSCKMEFVNATLWIKEDGEPNDRDCEAWENEENKLCFDCQTCKMGYTFTLQRKWQKLGMFLIFMSLLLIICHLLLFLATMWSRFWFCFQV